MSLIEKIKFLKQCKNNPGKLNFYLDISDSNISCGPCLVLKHYYDWCLKFLFKAQLENESKEEFFKRIIEKLDYKVIANMEHDEIKQLTAAYYSLAEINYHHEKTETSKEYFNKVIEVMEEFLKSGSRFQTQEIQQKNGVVLFEILMWARKSLADMLNDEDGLALYDSMIAEEELLYLQKYYGTFKVAQRVNNIDKVNEAVRAVMKILPDYEGINKDAVDYLIEHQDYINAIALATDEYKRESSTHWINKINQICSEAEELSPECTQRILDFEDILLEELKITEWSTLALTLYRSIRGFEAQTIILLDYLKNWLSRVDYNSDDFINMADSVLVLYDIYEDIRKDKYEKTFLRGYEFDFTFFLMNVAVKNSNYEKAVEASTKLTSLIEVCKENKKLYDYVEKCEKEAFENVTTNKYDLQEYPWYYLYKHLMDICEDYNLNENIAVNTEMKNRINRRIVGVNVIENKDLEKLLEETLNMNIFSDDKEFTAVTEDKFQMDSEFEERYNYKLLNHSAMNDFNSIIIASNKDSILDLTDSNVILVNGASELRNIDITYIRHIIQCGDNTRVFIAVKNGNTQSRETINYNKTIVEDIMDNKIEVPVIELDNIGGALGLFRTIIGEEPQKTAQYRFKSFKDSMDNTLKDIDEDMKENSELHKKKRYVIKESIEEYRNLLEDLNSNYEEFTNKVNGDMDFLGQYASEKMAVMIPDVIEKNLSAIDDLDDGGKIKDNAEKIFSGAIVKWCKKNIYDLLLEQFQVCISRYSKIYDFHEATIERLSENRNKVLEVHEEFSDNVKIISKKNLEEILKDFLEYYDECASKMEFKATVIPSEHFLSSVADGIKVMFMKSEEKAETSRVKIKNQVIENKENIAEDLAQDVNSKLAELGKLINDEITEIFREVKEDMEEEKTVVENLLVTMDKQHEETSVNNEKIQGRINLLRTEILKFKKQVDNNLVYNEEKCYEI